MTWSGRTRSLTASSAGKPPAPQPADRRTRNARAEAVTIATRTSLSSAQRITGRYVPAADRFAHRLTSTHGGFCERSDARASWRGGFRRLGGGCLWQQAGIVRGGPPPRRAPPRRSPPPSLRLSQRRGGLLRCPPRP